MYGWTSWTLCVCWFLPENKLICVFSSPPSCSCGYVTWNRRMTVTDSENVEGTGRGPFQGLRLLQTKHIVRRQCGENTGLKLQLEQRRLEFHIDTNLHSTQNSSGHTALTSLRCYTHRKWATYKTRTPRCLNSQEWSILYQWTEDRVDPGGNLEKKDVPEIGRYQVWITPQPCDQEKEFSKTTNTFTLNMAEWLSPGNWPQNKCEQLLPCLQGKRTSAVVMQGSEGSVKDNFK